MLDLLFQVYKRLTPAHAAVVRSRFGVLARFNRRVLVRKVVHICVHMYALGVLVFASTCACSLGKSPSVGTLGNAKR